MTIIKCNKCGDESDTKAGFICGRSLAEETGLPAYCDGVSTDTAILKGGELRSKVMVRAFEIHGEAGEREIDQDARVTEVSGEGYWVTAHLWVPVEAVE